MKNVFVFIALLVLFLFTTVVQANEAQTTKANQVGTATMLNIDVADSPSVSHESTCVQTSLVPSVDTPANRDCTDRLQATASTYTNEMSYDTEHVGSMDRWERAVYRQQHRRGDGDADGQDWRESDVYRWMDGDGSENLPGNRGRRYDRRANSSRLDFTMRSGVPLRPTGEHSVNTERRTWTRVIWSMSAGNGDTQR